MPGLTIETLLISLSLTIIFETVLALLWGVRQKRDILLIVLANIVTNPVAVTLYYFFCKYLGLRFMVVLIELGVVIIEALIYEHRASDIKKCLWFSAAANIASYGLGYILNVII